MTPETEVPTRRVLLDACCVLTLSATGRLSELIADLPYQFAIVEACRQEAMWLKIPSTDDREHVDLSVLVDSRALAVETVTGDDELALLVEFAASLGDGEAASAAVAVSRGYLLATDDRKARRVVQSAHPEVEQLTTAQLLEHWQRLSGLPSTEMADILKKVTARATFTPPKNDPARSWWDATLQASEKS